MSDAGDDEGTSPTDDWQDYFAFEEPYANQRDAIETAIDVGADNGYLLMEGPCGTGKTMAALTAATTLLSEESYENVLVVTPVKQQRQQFVEDLRALNANLAEPFAGISLSGKRDLCPYGREGQFPEDVSVHERCDDLRENTAGLVEGESGGPPVGEVAIGGVSGEDSWWDPEIAAELVRIARTDTGQQALGDGLSTAGVESPYRPAQPSAQTEEGGETLYCPFEADWYARNRGSPFDFGAHESHVLTDEEYLAQATERGTCPHRVMGVLLEEADIIIGNYNHLFDPDSRPLVESVLDERTFLIVDEAHRLEERVRELLSTRVGMQSLKRAENDLRTVLSRANQSADAEQTIRTELEEQGVPLEALETGVEFYGDVIEWVDQRIQAGLAEQFGEWPTTEIPDEAVEIPLRDPETVEQDELTTWAVEEGYTGELWKTLPTIGAGAELALDALGLDRTPVCGGVGALMARWWECDHATYLREIELEQSPGNRDGWAGEFTAGLVLFECMPADSLRSIFDELGGGLVMSATLEPLDVFREVSGLSALESDCRVESRTYNLPFPSENRASWIVDATPFTARNRGDPNENADQATWNQTRDEYAQVLRILARSPGNVLIAMPNYREAAWAGAYLETAVEQPVLLDSSSSFEETESLKQEFYDHDDAVLVTSVRGTLTEGVDYDGDKLHCCAVVGIPLVNIGSPRVRAIRRSYGEAFGSENAFEYALTVPAVRRARQTIGRVIRGAEEVGVRALVGRRYVPDARHSVFEFLSPGERAEFVRLTPEFLEPEITTFWNDRVTPPTGNR